MLTGPELGAAIEAARKLKGVTKKAIADAFGVAPPSVQDWVKRGTIDKQKLPALWAYFRDVVGPEHWGLTSWGDAQPASQGVFIQPVAQDMSYHAIETGPITARLVPVIGTLQLGASGMFELKTGPGGQVIGAVPAFSGRAGSYAVRIFGDDLYPAVRNGACLVVEPGGTCQEGELALVQTTAGHYFVCELVSLRDATLTYLPAQGGTRRTLGRDEITAIHPVLDVTSASRFIPAD